MNESDLETHLADIFENISGAEPDEDPIIPIAPELLCRNTGVHRVSTFAEAGVLTRNAGVVVRMQDGREFQITVVRSK